MKTTKHVALVALLVLGATAIVPGTPALAAGNRSANLECLVNESDPDYGAWGTMKVGSVQYLWTDTYGSLYRAKVNVTCRDLTPGTTYYTNLFGSFSASASGGGTAGGEVTFYYDGIYGGGGIGVMVQRDDGVYVLAGYVPLSLPK